MPIYYYIIKFKSYINYYIIFMAFFSSLWESLSNPKFYYMILYLFFSLMALVSYTKPSFGFDLLNLKMAKGLTNFAGSSGFNIFETIGLGSEELYFYLGYLVIYTILIFYITYNRIHRCIEEYRKRDPKYANYSAWDFVTNNVTDVMSDAFRKTIGTLIPPIVLFFIITIGYLVINNVSKVAVPIKVVTAIVNYGMVIIVPIINIWLFIVYFLIIDSAIPC